MQTCVIHLLRNTFRITSREYWDEVKRDVKPIYTAVNATAARSAFDELAEKWGQRYPAVIRLWDNAWNEFIRNGRMRVVLLAKTTTAPPLEVVPHFKEDYR